MTANSSLRILTVATAIVGAVLAQQPSGGRPVLMVSIDGLRPDYVTQADQHKLKLPHLRQLLKDGTYASGVRGVFPTVTYTSHTALITGVTPARHGIVANHPFEPDERDPNAWYWYTEDIRVPTLWDAAAHAGYVVGSISWPVTVGAGSIRYNLPEFAGTRTPQDLKMVRALATPAVFDELGKTAGPYIVDVKQAIPRDWARTHYAAAMIRQKHARFLTVHLAALDHTQHEKGPFGAPAIEAIEATDRMIGTLIEAMRAEDPRFVICVVSDHGFSKVDHVLRLDAAFVEAGLITPKAKGESLATSGVENWIAMPWSSSGSAAIILRDPKNQAAAAKVRVFLDKLAADPANGIAAILDTPQIAKLGGTTAATFWVDMRPGFSITPSLEGSIAASVSIRGTHGYSPEHPELRSFFALAGDGIRRGVNLGEIDMRSIAPTLARVLGVPFPSADLPAQTVLAGQ